MVSRRLHIYMVGRRSGFITRRTVQELEKLRSEGDTLDAGSLGFFRVTIDLCGR
jgi:hypothetical protein